MGHIRSDLTCRIHEEIHLKNMCRDRHQHPVWALVQVPAALFSLQLPAGAPGRAARSGSQCGCLGPPWDPGKASGSSLRPGPVRPFMGHLGSEPADGGRHSNCFSNNESPF